MVFPMAAGCWRKTVAETALVPEDLKEKLKAVEVDTKARFVTQNGDSSIIQ